MNFAYYYITRILIVIIATLFASLNYSNAQNCDKAFSLTGADDFDIHSMTTSHDGNLLVVGSFIGTQVDFDPGAGAELRDSPVSVNAFIASYTPTGQLNWVESIGGEANLKFYDIAVNKTGRIFVCGSAGGTAIDLDPGESNTNHQLPENTTGMVVACYSEFGSYRWGFIIPAEYNWELQSSISPNTIELDQKGNIFIAGSFQTTYMDLDPGLGVKPYETTISESVYNDDAFLVKYTQNGNYIWSTAIQSLDTDNCQSLAIDEQGNSYLCGAFSGDNTVFSSGTGYMNLTSFGETDIFFSKYDAAGNLQWAKNMGSFEIEQAHDIKIDSDTNIYITGVFKGAADMDPDPEVATISSRGSFDCFFAKYDKNGEFIFAKSVGSDEYDNVYGMSINSNQNIYLTGYYKARADNDFDPGDGIKKLDTNILDGNNYLFVANYTAGGELIWATSGISQEGIYGSAVLSLKSGSIFLGGHFNGSFGSIPTIGDNLYQLEDEGKTGIFLATITTTTNSSILYKQKSVLTVYPNPVSTTINLKMENNNNDDEFNIELFTISGKIIYQNKGNLEQIESGLNQFNSSLTKGSYFINMNSGNEIFSGSFIKN